jgi:hypothetical protein
VLVHDHDDEASIQSWELRELQAAGLEVSKGEEPEEEEEEEEEELPTGTYFTFSYMVWGVLLLLDIPLQISDLLFGDQSELMLFSQCMVIALQVVLIAFFKPFEPVGVTYFALIAGFLEFNLAAIGGFMALFSKFCDTEMGKSYAHYIPMLEALANAFTIGVMLWTLGLILGKLITVLLPSAAASKDDVEEAVE